MVRSLKFAAAAVAAAAVVALGVASISGAAGPEFHCSVEPCRITVKPDGTGKTAHQVIQLWGEAGTNFQTTCSTVTGAATASAKSFGSFKESGIVGTECTVAGQPAELKMNGCEYVIAAAGTLTIECPTGKQIEAGMSPGCLYFIPSQGPLSGLTFHNVSGEVTAETFIKSLSVTTNGQCGTTGKVTAEFTTGNTLLTGETDPGGVKTSLTWE
jgi:hypothetical protein